MGAVDESLTTILGKLSRFRREANLAADAIEQDMLLGPGWIERFESGLTVPPLDMLLVLLEKYNRIPTELFADVDLQKQRHEVVRALYAEADADDLLTPPNTHASTSGKVGNGPVVGRLKRSWFDTTAPFLNRTALPFTLPAARKKKGLANYLKLPGRVETDKIDVVLATVKGDRRIPFGVVHVKASFAERRTDDVPLSQELIRAGFLSPLWTMDCKSTPAKFPKNKGELGVALRPREPDARSAKRKDIEDDGYFSACLSYNQNTVPTPNKQRCKAHVHCCDCSESDDAFSRFILDFSRKFPAKRKVK